MPLRDLEGTAHHLLPGLGPRVAVALDRVPRLRAAVGTVHHAHEVRRRRGEPELDGPVVERADADQVRVLGRPQVVVLSVLEHEVDRDRRARARRGSTPA